MFRRRKRPVGRSWRMDETYVKVGGQWKYLYRAVDRAGDTARFANFVVYDGLWPHGYVSLDLSVQGFADDEDHVPSAVLSR